MDQERIHLFLSRCAAVNPARDTQEREKGLEWQKNLLVPHPLQHTGQSPPGHPGPSEDTKMSHFSLRVLPWGWVKFPSHFKVAADVELGWAVAPVLPFPVEVPMDWKAQGVLMKCPHRACSRKKTLPRSCKRHIISQ